MLKGELLRELTTCDTETRQEHLPAEKRCQETCSRQDGHKHHNLWKMLHLPSATKHSARTRGACDRVSNTGLSNMPRMAARRTGRGSAFHREPGTERVLLGIRMRMAVELTGPMVEMTVGVILTAKGVMAMALPDSIYSGGN